MKSLIIPIFIAFTINTCFSQNELRFIYDHQGTSIASGENIYAANQFINQVEGHLFDAWIARMDSLHKRGSKALIQTFKFLLIDLPIVNASMVYQHERGHAFRRNAAGFMTRIGLDTPAPFGSGGGITESGALPDHLLVGTSEQIAFKSAGIEASSVMAGSIRNSWLKQGYVNKSESLLYLFTFHDPTFYIFFADSEDATINNDIRQYLIRLHDRHQIRDPSQYRIDEGDLKTRAVLNLLNPIQFFALSSLFSSNKQVDIKGIDIGKFDWLPSFRFGLNPFGPEFIIENAFYNDKHIFDTNIRIGEATFEKNYGIGVHYYRYISPSLSLNLKTDLWYQPSMELGGFQRFNTGEGIGGRLLAEISYRDYNKLPIGVFCQVGYKTDGHIEGELLDKQAIARIGISLDKSYMGSKANRK